MGGFLIKGKENFAGVRRRPVAASDLQPLGENGQSRRVPDRQEGVTLDEEDVASVDGIAESSETEACVFTNTKVRKQRDEEEAGRMQAKRRRLFLVPHTRQKQKRILPEDFEDPECRKKRLKTDDQACSSFSKKKKKRLDEREEGESERTKKRRMDSQESKRRSKKRRREEQEEDDEDLVGVKADFSSADAEIQQRFAQSLSL